MAKGRREPQRTSSEDPTGQQPGDPTTKPVVDLLTSILTDVQTKVGRQTPKLGEGAVAAVEEFREIGAILALLPTISLTANPTKLDQTGDVTLTWSSTEARTVSIEAEDPGGFPLPQLSPGEVPPDEVKGGSTVVRNVPGTTIFTATATAKGPCGSAEAEALVVVGSGVP
jgi:hypothetical protein